MKINVRILLITFFVVVFVTVISSVIYYSLTNTIIKSQNSTNLLNSTNDFVFLLESSIEKTDEDFQKNFLAADLSEEVDLNNLEIDFLFTLTPEDFINTAKFYTKDRITLNYHSRELEKFTDINPNIILRFRNNYKNETIFYGRIIDQKFLDDASKKIRSEIALIINDLPFLISNSSTSGKYQPNIVDATRDLKFRNNYDLKAIEIGNADLLASKYQPKNLVLSNNKLNFIIFNVFTDTAEFREAMNVIIIVTIATGIILSLIFALLFTTKFRKQISLLTQAAQVTKRGDLKHRIKILTKDEIGQLGEAFNDMLNELQKKELQEKDYSEFITIINQNPSLDQIADASLNKIMKSTHVTFGSLYLKDSEKLRLLSSKGINKSFLSTNSSPEIEFNIFDKKEPVEIVFKENFPTLKSAVFEIKIKYLYIVPIIFNRNVIGILELASENVPDENPSKYINSITEQLAIGLNNAKSYESLQNFVNELKKLNDEYQRQNEQIKGQNKELIELHKKLKEKASELEEERRKAIELTNVKSQFLANMSHELKTPLNSIIGLTELTMNDSITQTRIKDRTKIVLRNGKKLLSMINNILEFSKIDSSKFEITKTNFLLNALLNDIYSSTEPLASEKNLDFRIVLNKQEDFLLNTDKSKLEHIILNLLSNAIKFTDKGIVKIEVANIKPGDLSFKISDTGIGISKENQNYIFEEFKQLDSGNQKKYSGAGLGLAICKKYSELLGGTLNVESSVGKGSVFTFILPSVIIEKLRSAKNLDAISTLAQDEELKSGEEKSAVNSFTTQESIARSRNIKILVVDDDNDTLFTVGEILQNLGYEISFASNGIECLNAIEKNHPEIILLDIMMPKMDGFETIKKIRSITRYNSIIVIALTAHAMLDDKHIIESTGFNDLITKPVNSTTIQLKIQQALANKLNNRT